jgi:hypothetical protein
LGPPPLHHPTLGDTGGVAGTPLPLATVGGSAGQSPSGDDGGVETSPCAAALCDGDDGVTQSLHGRGVYTALTMTLNPLVGRGPSRPRQSYKSRP